MVRILVVEDDDDVRGLIVSRLGGAGHRVVAAASPTEAFAILEERGAPEVVVLDVGLPEMDGLELLSELRRRLGDDGLPAIFLSARVQDQDIEAGRALGAVYLTKPFIAAALISAVERSVRTKEPESGW